MPENIQWRFFITHGMNGIHTSYEWTLDQARAGIAQLMAMPETVLARIETLDGEKVEPSAFGIVTLVDGEDSEGFGVTPAEWL